MTRRRGFTRQQIIAGFFAFVGLLIIVSYASRLGAPEPVSTRLLFGIGGPVLEVPTALTMFIIGVVYLVAGGLGLFRPVGRPASRLLWLSGFLLFPAILIAAAAGKQTNALTMISETLRLGTPLALGALAGIYCERSGVINIAIEGMMLLGAAFGFAAFVLTNNIWLGVLFAVIVGGLAALLHGWLSISLRTDQIISGTVINILAIGLTGYLRRGYLVETLGGRTTLPVVTDLPLIGPVFMWLTEHTPLLGNILFNNKPIFYTMILLVIGTHIVLFSMRWGLRLRAVGENPRAADTLGINVYRTRYINVVIGGMIAGLAGAWFSLETVGTFDDGMTAGKGFIALAAMIFGKWTPFGAFGGAMLFGFAEALSTRFQILGVQVGGSPLPVQFLQILPYVTTMVVLAGLIGRATPPAASGQPYIK
jgi:general nucleoside transport system permease protein